MADNKMNDLDYLIAHLYATREELNSIETEEVDDKERVLNELKAYEIILFNFTLPEEKQNKELLREFTLENSVIESVDLLNQVKKEML